jgi:hypothetical protein
MAHGARGGHLGGIRGSLGVIGAPDTGTLDRPVTGSTSISA